MIRSRCVHLNKQLKPEAHLAAADVFRELGLSFDFGYMVLEPYSTFDSVRGGIDFLDEFVGDGWTVSTFCRTLPYAGTPLAEQLRAEHRLLGTPFDPDYRFLDPRLDVFYDWMLQTFRRRNFTDAGLCHILRALQFELHLHVAGRRRSTAAERNAGRYLVVGCQPSGDVCVAHGARLLRGHDVRRHRGGPSFLFALTQHAQDQETRLETEAREFYARVQVERE